MSLILENLRVDNSHHIPAIKLVSKIYLGRIYILKILLIVHEDYQRVMKEYKTIEDQGDKKMHKHQFNGVKRISPHKKREIEK